MIDAIVLHILMLVFLILTLIQGDRSATKATIFAPVISQSLESIWMELGLLIRLVGMMNLVFILSGPFSIQGENVTYMILLRKSLTLAFIQTFMDLFRLNLVWWQKPLSSTFWFQFEWPIN